ncbi:SMP-30/gluconolactonase/LRE family protein [Galbibacter sp. BG1]|uniref:SMP-30/gluconolactonase/LRE family protein n=1 Tax=Galbibacter sp. BG1 TaxID=1170699 RepID=UPI0015C0FD47|nr:SMP-30/gluconolactonase/LRE family protein [Galbibacter sp. BG1]QLE02434.1 SMP-30/gluconolactonase/LRE family protein [Galbibacter sp. BG1]
MMERMFVIVLLLACFFSNGQNLKYGKVEKVAGGFKFTEGPAADREGNLYFSDVIASKIYKFNPKKGVDTVVEDTKWGNGIYISKSNDLFFCQNKGKNLVKLLTNGKVKHLLTSETSNSLNSPNDLWIVPSGGIYFTDPNYDTSSTPEIEGVYFLGPNKEKPICVEQTLTRPNGIIATPKGDTLYITDHGDNKTWRYTVNKNGGLKNKELVVEHGGDGITLDYKGRIYITDLGQNAINIYTVSGESIDQIDIPETPSNVAFGGEKRNILFVTARTSLYAIKTNSRAQEKTY